MPFVNKDVYAGGFLGFLDRHVDSVVTRKRREILELIDREIATGGGIQTALDIGSTRDTDMASSNFFARELSKHCRVTLFSDQTIDPAADLNFPVEATLIGDAADIDAISASGAPLGTYDLVISSATIEHVGDTDSQARMLATCLSLANRYVVVTTPNRWHPLEFHTRLPFLHWLPKPAYRWLLHRLGLSFFADEEHLNLLDRRALARLAEAATAGRGTIGWRIEKIRLFGFVSNLVLIARLPA